MSPSVNYGLFAEAERLNLPVAKLLTGKDMPLSNMEFVLNGTYNRAKQKLQELHNGRGKGRRR